MMKILIVPAWGHGHVNPVLPLATALVEQGDNVTIVVSHDFVAAASATGGEVIDLGPGLVLPTGLTNLSPEERMARVAETMGNMRERITEMLGNVAALDPDVVVYDVFLSMVGVTHLAELTVPKVAFYPTFASPPGVNPMTALQMSAPAGVSGNGSPFSMQPLTAEPLNIVMVPRSYQPNADTFDDRYLFVGPTLRHELAAPDFPYPPDDGRPLVYVSLGTAVSDNPAFYRAALEAIAARPWRAIVATGRTDLAELGEIPANVTARPAVPQLGVLAQADLFVTHGGMNSTLESLLLGVPMVVVPQGADQFLNGQRVAELGVGIDLAGEDLTPERLLQAMDAVLADPSYAARARALRADVQAGGGAQQAAAAIHAHLGALLEATPA